jgi:hypothetical protein
MRRLFALLLPLVLLMAATATPAIACVNGMPGMRMRHSCQLATEPLLSLASSSAGITRHTHARRLTPLCSGLRSIA